MKRISVLFTTLLIFFIMTPISLAETEDNNTYENADVLQINSSDSGYISQDLPSGKDYYDYYKITTPSDGSLNVQISSSAPLYDVRLNLIQTNGVAVLVNFDTARDYDYSGGYTVSGSTLAKGTYYVQIVGDDDPASYSISNTFTPIPQANDEVETNENDSVDTAMNLGLNTVKEGHMGYRSDIGIYDSYDYYKLTLSESGSLDISIIANEIFDDVRLTRLQDNGVLVLVNFDTARDYDGSDGGYRVFDNNLDSGDYYLMIHRKLDLAGGYTINTSSSVSDGSSPEPQPEPESEPEPTPEPEPEPGDKTYESWTKTSTDNISKQKTWTIVFNDDINKDYLTSDYIYVKDSSGEKLNTELGLDTNKKVLVSSPALDYESGKTYTLYIESSIKSSDNKSLSNGIKMKFTIEGESETPSYNEGTLTHNGFDFSEAELRLDDVEWDAEFDARKDGSLVFWEPVLGDQYEEGLWIRYGDENILKNVTADLGQVSFDSVKNISDAEFTEAAPKLIVGHIYIVKTRENGYAKIEVLSLDETNVTASIRWIYSSSGDF
ncbi:MAG: hypothetical protein N4A40_06745 [Tissierellales bacterium]|nr:hypothetical protein [Tissierellales bacterium]